jgi:hypothetical protein
MPDLQTCSLEPFLYDAVPVDSVSQAAEDYWGGSISPQQSSSSSNQINQQKIEDYMNRLREAICADLTALEARVATLESP